MVIEFSDIKCHVRRTPAGDVRAPSYLIYAVKLRTSSKRCILKFRYHPEMEFMKKRLSSKPDLSKLNVKPRQSMRLRKQVARELALEQGTTSERVRWYQTILKVVCGFPAISITGNHNDPDTRQAIKNFQRFFNLEQTGYLSVFR